jgi:hypothetical protein
MILFRQTGLNPYGEHFGPNRAWFSEPQVCGHNATKSGYGVDTAVVLAGSEIGFQAIASTYKEGQLEVPHVVGSSSVMRSKITF